MAKENAKENKIEVGTEVIAAYDNIRNKYLQASRMASSSGSSFSPSTFLGEKGFYKATGNFSSLGQRTGGLDKLFYTLIQGVVEDPDYALKKDRKIYNRMLRDPQVYYCLEVRKAATTSLPWTIAPPQAFEHEPKAQELAADVENRLQQIPRVGELFDNLMDALLPGIAICELVWTVTQKGEYVVTEHFPMNKDRFRFEKNGRLRMLSPQSPITGLPVAPYKFLKHIFNLSDGSWQTPEDIGYSYYGKGLADTPLYHYFHFKIAAIKYLMQSMERTGFPAKILYTGAQNTMLAKKLSSIMVALKNDAVVSIPGRPDEIKVEQFKVTATWQLFMQFMQYVDRLITRAILGQDLMTEVSTSGSYSLGQVHQDVFQMIRERDKRQLADTLTRTLVAYDCLLNNPQVPKEYWPHFVFRQSALSDAANFLEVVAKVLQMGVDVSVSQVRELTGLKEPQATDSILKLLQKQQQQQQLEGQNNVAQMEKNPQKISGGTSPNQTRVATSKTSKANKGAKTNVAQTK